MKEILHCEIKELKSYKEFETIFKAYTLFPYYEEWRTAEIRAEYELNKENGFIYGCYYNGICVGLVSMNQARLYNHPIHFEEIEKVLYISNIVVDINYRYHGFGTKLTAFAVKFAKNHGYKAIYFRYRERHEFGAQIAKRLGFVRCMDVCQEVIRPRTKRGSMKNNLGRADLRFFMKKEL